MQTVFDVAAPRLAFSSAAYSVAESGGTALITVTLSAPNPFADTSVAYATSDGSAHAGSDYTAQAGTLIIPAGQSSASFSVPILNMRAGRRRDGAAEPEQRRRRVARHSQRRDADDPSQRWHPAAQITSPPPLGAKRSVAYSHLFTAIGLPQPSFTLTAGVLPPGLALSADGKLSGKPTQAGSYTGIRVTASNGMAPDATQTFSIVVSATGVHVYLPLAASVETPRLKHMLSRVRTSNNGTNKNRNN